MAAGASEKGYALDWIDGQRQRFSDFHQEIWRHAEPAWREYRSARAHVDLLRGAGFTVEEGSAGMPTAFCATWGEGRPVLASYAEYDAVPGGTHGSALDAGRRHPGWPARGQGGDGEVAAAGHAEVPR